MELVCDFHIHSPYSRGTSPRNTIPQLSAAARTKGIHVLGTGDFTHPQWLEELTHFLAPADDGSGLYEYGGTKFILTTELSCVFRKDGALKKIHIVYFAPNFEVVEQIIDVLSPHTSLSADGRPTLPLSASELTERLISISRDIFVLPAHIWTPWFSLFGSRSGFDRIEDCFEDMTKHVGALETGLSSDPPMNWMVRQLDRFPLLSNSDAHSPENVGREMSILSVERVSYKDILSAIRNRHIAYTLEFFPEEGKYHFDGHRDHHISFHPEETRKHNGICPVCKKPLTIGVLHRVYELADRPYGEKPANAPPFIKWVPLSEIAHLLKISSDEYDLLIQKYGNELSAFNAPADRLKEDGIFGEAILRVRSGAIKVIPGYDGVFGSVHIFDELSSSPSKKETKTLLDFV